MPCVAFPGLLPVLSLQKPSYLHLQVELTISFKRKIGWHSHIFCDFIFCFVFIFLPLIFRSFWESRLINREAISLIGNGICAAVAEADSGVFCACIVRIANHLDTMVNNIYFQWNDGITFMQMFLCLLGRKDCKSSPKKGKEDWKSSPKIKEVEERAIYTNLILAGVRETTFFYKSSGTKIPFLKITSAMSAPQ